MSVDALPLDDAGFRYRETESGPMRVTPCCGAFATGSTALGDDDFVVVCRTCYEEVDPLADGPAVLSGPTSTTT